MSKIKEIIFPFCRLFLHGVEAYGLNSRITEANEIYKSISNSQQLPQLSGIDGSNDYSIHACSGTTLCFDVFSEINKSGQNITLNWDEAITGAVFSSLEGLQASGHFCWDIPSSSPESSSFAFNVLESYASDPCHAAKKFTFTIFVHRPVIALTTMTPLCSGPDNGSASVKTSGGNAPYSYEWFPGGETNSSVTNLKAGEYHVLVTDDNGCTSSEAFQLENRHTLQIQATTVPASCHSNDGSITLSVKGGFEPYEFHWENSVDRSGTIQNLEAGNYTYEVIDSRGCKEMIRVFVDDLAPKLMMSEKQSVHCEGGSDGKIFVTGKSQSSLTYSWEPVHANCPSIAGLSAGAYTVTATDERGCSTQLQTEITYEFENPGVNLGSDRNTCQGEDVMLDGGNFHSFLWTDNSTNRYLSARIADTYSVMVTDSNGCVTVDAVRLDFIDCSKPEELKTIHIYPNPVRQEATISMDNENGEDLAFEIYDLMGKIVLEKELNTDGEIREEISTCNWMSGIYMLRVMKGGQLSVQKFIKQ